MGNTLFARRGNKIVRIDESAVTKYKAAGYTISDKDGKVVATGTPHNVNQLASAYAKATDEIKSLKSQVEDLKAKNSALTKELDKYKSMPISSEPKQTRRRKQTTVEETE